MPSPKDSAPGFDRGEGAPMRLPCARVRDGKGKSGGGEAKTGNGDEDLAGREHGSRLGPQRFDRSMGPCLLPPGESPLFGRRRGNPGQVPVGPAQKGGGSSVSSSW